MYVRMVNGVYDDECQHDEFSHIRSTQLTVSWRLQLHFQSRFDRSMCQQVQPLVHANGFLGVGRLNLLPVRLETRRRVGVRITVTVLVHGFLPDLVDV